MAHRRNRAEPESVKPALARVTAVEATTEAVRQAILRARYAPGQRLIEADLMQEYAVSRGPIREALRRLSSEGLIDIEPYRGAVVRRLSRKSLADSFELREVLEGVAARSAAQHYAGAIESGTGAAQTLRDFLRREEGGDDDTDTHLASNAIFHAAIIRLSGNMHVSRLLAATQTPALRIHFAMLLDSAAVRRSYAEHREIASAIVNSDAVGAEKAIRKHVRSTAKLTLQLPDYLFPGDKVGPD